MFNVKFRELFGSQIGREIQTSESGRHGMLVAFKTGEIFVEFGGASLPTDHIPFVERVRIPLPENADYGAMMAIGYYIIGRIQASRESYFKIGLERYCQASAKSFGHPISPLVM